MELVLLEREAELQVLTEALDAAAQGHGCCALVAGEAGSGKTSLLRGFADAAHDRARLWVGACEDLLTPRTLGPFRDIARQTGGEVRDVLATAADSGAVVEVLLSELAYPLEPTVIVVEDLHWADDATLDVIRLVTRRVAELPSLLVLTYRDDELHPAHPLQRVLGGLAGPSVRRLSMQPLSPTAVRTLAGDGAADDLHRITGGNPFFVTEVLACADDRVPTTVRDAIHARLLQLAPETRSALELLCVVPSGVERPLAEALLGGDLVHLADAEERGVLRANEHQVWFRHELTRQALDESLPVSRRVIQHRRVTDALVAADADPARIVHHAVAAGDTARVLDHGPTAARRAARAGGHRQAASHYSHTLRFADRLADETAAQLRTEYTYELYHLRRFGDAAAEGRAAVGILEQLGDAATLGAALITLSRATYWAGDPAGARDAAERAVAVCEPLGRTPLLAQAWIALAHVLMQADDLDAIGWAERAVKLGHELDREDLVLAGLGYVGTVRMGRGHAGGEDTVLQSLRLAQARDDDVGITRVCANLVRDLLRHGRLADADRYVELGLTHARKAEFVHGLYMLRARQAELAALRGSFDDAEAALRDLVEQLPDAGVNSSLVLAWLGRLAARRGSDEAEELLHAAWQLAEPTGELQWLGPVSAARVEAAWLAGDRDAALTAGEHTLALADRLGHPWLAGELRRYLVRAGHVVEASASCAPAWTLGLQGAWQAAAAAWGEESNPYERALELMEIPDEVAVLEAIAVLDQLGATPAALLARQRLRALGVTRIPRGPQAQTRENPAGLTARQSDVLVLLAEGRTNAEIADHLVLSVRTVDHHVAAILNKLGVSSRKEAARIAADLGLLPHA